MSNRSKRSNARRKVTGSRKQLVARSAIKPGAVDYLKKWWSVGAATVALAIVLSVGLLGGCGRKESSMPANTADRVDMYSAPPEMQIDPGKTYVATISTAKGDIVVQLDAAAAPKTVNNFVFLAREGFYNGLTFHRVEPGFVIQGGDPAGTGGGGPGYKVEAEIGLPHVDGAIATARTGDNVNPERLSSGSQFYITLGPQQSLDGQYTVFGRVTEGMDLTRAIAVGDVIDEIDITEGD